MKYSMIALVAVVAVTLLVSGPAAAATATPLAAVTGATPKPPPTVHLSGTLAAIGSGSLTVSSGAAQTTVPTSAATVVTVGGKASTLAALRAGMTAAITTVSGTATIVHATIPVVAVSGPITAISGGQITLKHSATVTQTFGTGAATTVTLKGAASTVAALKVGMHITGSTELGVATKLAATVPVVAVSGPITAISSGRITVQDTPTVSVPFDTSAATVVTLKAKPATVADLKVGMAVTGSLELGVATKLAATVPVVAVSGVVTAISGGQITLQHTATVLQTFGTSAGTVVTLKAKPATAADLKVGMHITGSTELGIATKLAATVPVVAVSGTITAISGTKVTLQHTATAVQTFDTAGTTVVTLKAKPATAADLKVGMHITGSTELGIATKLAATVPVVAVSGPITAINGTKVTVQDTPKVSVAFDTDAATVVTVEGKAATAGDLKVGMAMTGSLELGIATKIKATIPTIAVSGPITAISGGRITVQDTPTVSVAFDTGAATVVTVEGKAATAADLKVGMTVTGSLELGVATKITATIPTVKVAGKIVAIGGGQVSVQQTASQVTFTLGAATKITVNGKAATAADLTVNMTLTATMELNVAVTVVAKSPPA